MDYSVIRKGFSDLLVGNSFGDVVSVRVNDVIEVGAVGGSLVLGLAVTVDTGGWFRSRAAGTVYILVQPHLDVDSSSDPL